MRDLRDSWRSPCNRQLLPSPILSHSALYWDNRELQGEFKAIWALPLTIPWFYTSRRTPWLKRKPKGQLIIVLVRFGFSRVFLVTIPFRWLCPPCSSLFSSVKRKGCIRSCLRSLLDLALYDLTSHTILSRYLHSTLPFCKATSYPSSVLLLLCCSRKTDPSIFPELLPR